MTKDEWREKLAQWAFNDERLFRMPLVYLEPLAEILAAWEAAERPLHPTEDHGG